MKTWVKISILLLPTPLVLLFDGFYQFGVTNNRNIKSSWIVQDTTNYDILFHGPCEVIWTIDPEVVQLETGMSCYNLSTVHSDFANNYLSFYLYLKHHQAPQYLFLFVTPESMDKRFNVFYPHHFTIHLKDTLVRNVVDANAPDYQVWNKIPWLRYAYFNQEFNFNALQGWKHALTSKAYPAFKSGYVPPLEMKWDNHYEELYKFYPSGIRFRWNNEREKYLNRIIDLAQSHGTKIILYESPILASSTPTQENRDEVLNRIDELALAKNTEFWVFDTLSMCQDQKYFFSALNPNYEGGQLFSKIIAQKIKATLP